MSAAAPITLNVVRDTQPAGLVFVDHLPERHRPGKYAEIAAALLEQPGRWALVKTWNAANKKSAWGFANGVNAGKYRGMPKGRFEARTISTDDASRVYVRALPAVSA